MIQSVVVERFIAAAPETVFSFFTSRERWLLWQGVEATIDPRPGGAFRMDVRGDSHTSGQFVEVDPPRRIVFTWGWEGPTHPGWDGIGHPVAPGSTTVTVELEPEGDGTRLRLTHGPLVAPFSDLHRQGWEHYLDRLAVRATGGDPGPDPNVVSSR